MKHSDCKNFTPLDAFKGLCRANGGMVMIDSDTCPQFAAAQTADSAKPGAGMKRTVNPFSFARLHNSAASSPSTPRPRTA